jgi:hypothetical protein
MTNGLSPHSLSVSYPGEFWSTILALRGARPQSASSIQHSIQCPSSSSPPFSILKRGYSSRYPARYLLMAPAYEKQFAVSDTHCCLCSFVHAAAISSIWLFTVSLMTLMSPSHYNEKEEPRRVRQKKFGHGNEPLALPEGMYCCPAALMRTL